MGERVRTKWHFRGKPWLAALSVISLLAIVPAAPASADPKVPDGAAQATPAPSPKEHDAAVPGNQRQSKLGEGWDASPDQAVVGAATGSGYAVMAAESKSGYQWRTVATLRRAGVEADSWIGNLCSTADGAFAVVVYGPRTAVNHEAGLYQGGFAASVNIATGEVHDLGGGFTLAYFNPGCGTDQKVALTSYSSDGRTRISQFDAATGARETDNTVASQITSAVPTSTGIVGATEGGLVRISDSAATAIAATSGTPRELTVVSGGLAYVDSDGESATGRLLDLATGTDTAIGTGKPEDVSVARDAHGNLYSSAKAAAKVRSSHSLKVFKPHTYVSSEGRLVVDPPRPYLSTAEGTQNTLLEITAHSTTTGQDIALTAPVAEDQPQGGTHQPNPSARQSLTASGSGSSPMETERACAVARNDAHNQALQPKPRQVEWAVDQLVTGSLTLQRPANWKNLGMAAYAPSSMFPLPALSGGGAIPAQILLGIAAQESNLWQASRYVTPGVTGNPLVGNYYGNDVTTNNQDEFWKVDWSSADCGYGVMQFTDGMRRAGMERPGEVTLPENKQRAIALDYVANIAAGAQLLAQKWNQTRAAGVTINNGDPSYIENWFAAVWAYNTGFHPNDGSGAWGLGWLNNPRNPIYPDYRGSFLDGHPEDAASPQKWPYPEKVLGFAAHALELPESDTSLVAAFRTAWWPASDGQDGTVNRRNVKPPTTLFCVVNLNNCDLTQVVNPGDGDPAGNCVHKDAAGNYDLKCWWHSPATWKSNCDDTCGQEFIRFDPGWDYQADAGSFPPNCGRAGLPANALVVDDVPNGTAPILDAGNTRTCSPTATTGSFNFAFPVQPDGTVPAKMDLHQLGAGFNDHFHFSHVNSTGFLNDRLKITGTWSLGQTLNQWTRVLVHMPDHAGWTNQALYTINNGAGQTEQRSLLQRNFANTWVSLGVFQMNGVPSVSLSNTTYDQAASGVIDIAWDAVAFEPLAAKPKDFYVALGDSYSSGEGASNLNGSDFYRATDHGGLLDPDTSDHKNNCHRSTEAWPRKAEIDASGESVGHRSDRYDASLDFQFLACSGAETRHMLPFETIGPNPVDGTGHTGNQPQNGMMTQLDSGFLDANTTVVSLSIGGNDIKFGPVFQTCIGAAILNVSCAATPILGETIGVKDATLNRTHNEVPTSISVILAEIHKKAPNAKIVLMGYPKLFESGSACVGINDSERGWLNQVADDLATAMSSGVTAYKAANPTAPASTFANPASAFSGRNLCAANTMVNALVTQLTPGDQIGISIPAHGANPAVGLSMQSFHPNKAGTTAYSVVFNQALQSIGYRP
jgi:hypothetical protein